MRAFTFSGLPSRVVFGAGSIDRLESELDALGVHKALVLCTPQQEALAEGIAKSLGERCSGVYAGAVMHVPIESAVAAREEARRRDADASSLRAEALRPDWEKPSLWTRNSR